MVTIIYLIVDIFFLVQKCSNFIWITMEAGLNKWRLKITIDNLYKTSLCLQTSNKYIIYSNNIVSMFKLTYILFCQTKV